MSTATISTSRDLRETLRKMVAVLQAERQALAGLDLAAIVGATGDKDLLCGQLDGTGSDLVDPECRGLLEAARTMNEVNRQLRNLIAANVSARLDALTGGASIYGKQAGRPAAYAYAAARG